MKKDKESIMLHIPITYLCNTWKGEFRNLPPNKSFELILTYPLSNKARFKFKTGKNGMGLATVLKKIGKAYQHVYNNEEKYGIWGHEMSDLSLDGIIVNYKTKEITLVLSS